MEAYIEKQYCPHCGHELNHADNLIGSTSPTATPNKMRFGLCYFCCGILGFFQNKIVIIPDEILEHTKITKPKFYEDLINAQKTLLEVKNEK